MLVEVIIMYNHLVVISGPPASGKTTIAMKISEMANVILLSRDTFKETLFDSLGLDDRSWSRKLGAAAYDILYEVAENIMKTGQSVIIESNFNCPKRINKLLSKYEYSVSHIDCCARNDILLERFIARNESGNRHSGHVDIVNYDAIRNYVHHPVEIGTNSNRLDVNTDSFSSVNYDALIRFAFSKH